MHGFDGSTAAIVLAAGHGRRMGIAKALLDVDGMTLAEHHVTRLVEMGCAPIVIVLRPEIACAIGPRLECFSGLRLVAARTSSQAESLVAGVRALGSSVAAISASRILISPVDMMPPSVAVARTLHAALVPPLLAVTPTYGGRGGHPVLIRPEVFAPMLQAAERSPNGQIPSLRDVLEELGPRRARVEVADATVLGDFDAPADLPAMTSTSRGS